MTFATVTKMISLFTGDKILSRLYPHLPQFHYIFSANEFSLSETIETIYILKSIINNVQN